MRLFIITLFLFLSFSFHALACVDDDELRKEYPKYDLNPKASLTKKLETSYKQGESGIDIIINKLNIGIENPFVANCMSHAPLASQYLTKYIEDGIRQEKINCALLKAYEYITLVQNKYYPAKGLQIVTNTNFEFDQKFFEELYEKDLPKLIKMGDIWEEKLNCPKPESKELEKK